jgi:hypothetical protein
VRVSVPYDVESVEAAKGNGKCRPAILETVRASSIERSES